MKLKLLCAAALAAGVVGVTTPLVSHADQFPITLSEQGHVQTYTKKIYQIRRQNHSREYRPMGYWQDRQSLGLILHKGATIKLRQTNANYTGKIEVQLIGGSSATMRTKAIGSNWDTMTATEDMAVMVKTPHTNSVVPQLEYQVDTGTTTPLLQYSQGEDQQQFLQQWQASQAPYALIDTNNITIMVPMRDYDLVAKTNLDKLISEYDHDVFDMYNDLTGYTSNQDAADHHMGKYFAFADKTGAGSGYYSTNQVASNSTSAKTWLSINWLTLHEIGHGYEVPSKDMYLTDSFNNIYGTMWQLRHLSNFKRDAWVYAGNAAKATDYTMNSLLVGKSWGNLDYHPRLQLWLNLAYNLEGDQGFKRFNLYHKRAAWSKINVNNVATDWTQVYTHHFGLNVASYWQTLGVAVNGAENTNAYNQPAVAMLYQVVPDKVLNDKQAFANLLQQLGVADNPLASKVMTVTNDTLAKANLTSNVTVKLSDSDFAKVKGTNLYIRDGAKTVRTVKVDQQEFTLNDMPNGVYELGNDKLGKLTHTYLYVKDNGTINLQLNK